MGFEKGHKAETRRHIQHMTKRSGTLMDPVFVDVVIGLLAGLAATQVTNVAQGPLRWATPENVRQRESRVVPGAPSSQIAARKIGQRLKIPLTPREEEAGREAIHFATGIIWGPAYSLLRRYGCLRPFSAALASGITMSLILDEGLVPALGLSAPNSDYPALTHVRGFLAHLVYGAAVALVAEGLGCAFRRIPTAR